MSERLFRGRSLSEWVLLGTLVLLIAVAPLLGTRASAGIRDMRVEPVIIAMAFVFVAGFIFLRRLGTRRVPGLPIEVPAFAFLSFALFTVVFSPTIAQSSFTWVRYAMYCMLPLIVGAACVRAENRRILAWAFLAAGAGTIPQAVLQLVSPTADSMRFAIPGGVAVRVYSFFYNPNLYSEYLIFFIAIALMLAFTEHNWRRLLAVGLLICGVFLIVLTYTRGTWLGLMLSIVVVLFMIDLRALGAFVVASGGVLAVIPGAWERLVSAFSFNATTESRVLLWKLAGRLIAEHPVTGAGLGRYLPAIAETAKTHPELVTGETTLASHNSYLLIAGEIGVVGALLFVWVVWRACRMGLVFADHAYTNRKAKFEILAYTVGVIAFAVATFTDNGFQHPPEAVLFWVLIGMQAGAAFGLQRSKAQEDVVDSENTTMPEGERRWPFRVLFTPPKTRGRIFLDSRVAAHVIGRGVESAPDLVPWDTPLATTPEAKRASR